MHPKHYECVAFKGILLEDLMFLFAAHLSKIKETKKGISENIASKSGNAFVLTQRYCHRKVILKVLACCPIAPSTGMSFIDAMKHFSLPWIRILAVQSM